MVRTKSAHDFGGARIGGVGLGASCVGIADSVDEGAVSVVCVSSGVGLSETCPSRFGVVGVVFEGLVGGCFVVLGLEGIIGTIGTIGIACRAPVVCAGVCWGLVPV